MNTFERHGRGHHMCNHVLSVLITDFHSFPLYSRSECSDNIAQALRHHKLHDYIWICITFLAFIVLFRSLVLVG